MVCVPARPEESGLDQPSCVLACETAAAVARLGNRPTRGVQVRWLCAKNRLNRKRRLRGRHDVTEEYLRVRRQAERAEWRGLLSLARL